MNGFLEIFIIMILRCIFGSLFFSLKICFHEYLKCHFLFHIILSCGTHSLIIPFFHIEHIGFEHRTIEQ